MTDDRAEQLARAMHHQGGGFDWADYIPNARWALAAIDADPAAYGYQRAAKRLTFETREEMFAWLAAEGTP